jgi:hypothetical protein
MDAADLSNRFEYHPPLTDDVKSMHEAVRAEFGATADSMNDLLPEGREKALVMTNLEQAMFWANAAIARNSNGTARP